MRGPQIRSDVTNRKIDFVTILPRASANYWPWFQFSDSLGETKISQSNQSINDDLVGDELRVICFPS